VLCPTRMAMTVSKAGVGAVVVILVTSSMYTALDNETLQVRL
jgi:hypothetical protein